MTALISGAGIAGLTLAYWLAKYGYTVTLVEASPVLRMHGSPIDIKGKAVDVVKKMRIHGELVSKRIRTEKVVFVDSQGDLCASLDPRMMDDNIGQDIELLREDLIEVLYSKVKTNVEMFFGDSIVSVQQSRDHVEVKFKKEEHRKFNLVFGADGLHSNLRNIVFGEESQYTRFKGMYAGVVDIDTTHGTKNCCIIHNSPSKMAGIYNFKNSAKAILVFGSKKQLTYDYKNVDEHKKILARAFSNQKWKVTEILQSFRNAEEFYFDSVCQIKMERWTKQRVALLGDAAYCASFLTGRGTSLAIMGAYFLASSLDRYGNDYEMAFKSYEDEFHSIVKKAQAEITEGSAFLVPKSQLQIYLRNKLTQIMPFLARMKRFLEKN